MGAINPVSTVLSVLQGGSPLGIVGNVLSGFSRQHSDDQAIKQLQQRQRLEQQQSAETTALERERLSVQAAQDAETRREALRRAVARQRAQLGASGVGSQGGSAEAVLLGLFDETEDELARREELDNLRNRALDLGLTQQRALNVLQATQLAERQNLSRLF